MSKNVAYNADLNGFIPFERYYFEFSGLGGNWPSIISPVSGYFTTDKDGNYKLSASVAFCANTGIADCNPSADGYLDYNINSLIDLNLYTSIQLNVLDSYDSNVLSQVNKIECEGCRPSVEIETPIFVNLLKSNNGKADFNVHMDGLKIGEEYTYVITSLFGNWPMYVTPISGSFKAYEQTKTLTFTVDPCAVDSGCSSGNLLSNYTLDERDNYYSGFKFILTDSDGSSDYSSVIEAVCNDCLPDSPEILTTKNAILTSANSDTYIRNIDIINLNNNQTYYYVIENINTDNPVIIYPQSGTITNKNNTSFELDVVFCSSAGECVNSDNYIAVNSQGNNYFGTQPKDVTFDINLYNNLVGSTYSNLITSFNNVRTTCDQCIKIPQISLNQDVEQITLTTDSSTSIVANLANLEIGKKYRYTINNNSSTWPVELSKVSGEFTAKSNTKNISSTVKFCAATGLCDDVNFDPADVDADYKHAIFNVVLESLNTDIEDIISDNLLIICNDCIPKHRIGKLSANLYPNLYDNETITLSDNDYNFNMKFAGLVIGESYNYTINVNDSNWPIHFAKISGTFVATSPIVSISNMFELCPTSNGECSSLDNVISEVAALSTRLDDIFIDMTINLSSVNPELNVDLDSHDIRISCPSCLPSIGFSSIGAIPLTNSTAGFITVDLYGLEPNHEYYYILNSGESGSWPFSASSLSGYFTPTATAYSMSLPYSVVSMTGVNDYDISKTFPYSYSVYDSLKYKNLSITVGSYDVDINNITSKDFRLVCDDCFDDPNTDMLSVNHAQLINTININNSIIEIPIVFNHLTPGYRYGYEITSVDSNWPYRLLTSPTGFIEADNTVYTLNSRVFFCATSGSTCFDNRFNTDISSAANIALDYEKISNTIRIAFSGLEGDPLMTNQAQLDLEMVCENRNLCIDSLDTSVRVTTGLLPKRKHTISSNNLSSFNIGMASLSSNNTFFYQVNASDINWPVSLSNPSGYIKASEDLELDFEFCPTSDGECSINSPFAFTLDSCATNNEKHATFNIYYSGVDFDISPVNTEDFILSCEEKDLNKIIVLSDNSLILDNISGPSKTLLFTMNNLFYGETYEYNFTISDANWPLELSSYSGSFTANSDTHQLSNTITYCDILDGECASRVDSGGLVSYSINNLDPHAKVTLTVSGINCDIGDGIKTISVDCDNCRNNITLSNIEDRILNNTYTHQVNLNISDSNLFNLQNTYYYEIRCSESNWPIMVDNMSGIVTGQDIIKLELSFCPTSSGECSMESNTFAVNPINCKVRNNDKYGVFDIMVSGSGLDISNAISNQFTVTCPATSLYSIGIDAVTSNVYVLDSTYGNRINLNYNLSNLTAGETYHYSISSINANWPFRILGGNSGQFVSSDSEHVLKLVGEFCATTGGPCSLDAMNYSAKESCLMTYDDANNPTYSLNLNIDVWGSGCEVGDGNNKLTNISCVNCLNNIDIIEPADVTLVDTNSYPLYFTITGLKDSKNYTYAINCENANWPISMTPRTGILEADGSTFQFASSIMFCYPSGICADQDNVSTYKTYSYYDKITKGTSLSADMSLTITPSDECDEITHTSNKVKIVCENCLPAFSYASIVMSGSPEISLPESCCTGSLPVYVNVTDAIPGEPYTYNFSASSNNITFNPVSGTAYFDGTGSGTLITTVESELNLYAMSIIQCELTHDYTNEKVIDMIAIKCGESCPLE